MYRWSFGRGDFVKKAVKYTGIVAVMIAGLFLSLYFNNAIGTPKAKIEKDARISHKIDSSWQVAKSTTDAMSAMLFYDKDSSNYIFSIYENRKGLSFGYFFRSGGSTNTENEGITEYRAEGRQEKAYLSMNKQQVAKIEIDNGNTVEIIDIDHTKPFAIVLPVGSGAIKIYDKDGSVLPTIPQAL
ncbi:hypothetical protein DSY4334 [Desulfitobacterium hafniense Y51]|uniref:Uncharacterized protein n=1 Tax=Desulfitobacterium hafniense (strain Y51) TaxID=138119 RepID=Q24PB9_DESHY|nr:hypothetical protein DSY4334 [Desulfitobacterium hafniense Y51]